MNISLYQFELHEAIALYIKKEHGISINTDNIEYTSIEYQEREHVFKKHKNGRVVKYEFGHAEVDYDKSTYKTEHLSFSEVDEIHISLCNPGDQE